METLAYSENLRNGRSWCYCTDRFFICSLIANCSWWTIVCVACCSTNKALGATSPVDLRIVVVKWLTLLSILDVFMVTELLKSHVWWPGLKNSPTVTHACRKRRLLWVPSAWGYRWATLSPGDVNTETWSSRLGGWALDKQSSPVKRLLLWNPIRGGQGLNWAVEPYDDGVTEKA
jgi:hypothetical protein